jgi:hypothetical protein
VIPQRTERATFFNLDDFEREYPSNIHILDSYMFDTGSPFHYRVYAKDGETLLEESPELLSVEGYNPYVLETPLVIKDDFWVSIVPGATGLPRQFAQDISTPSRSYIRDEENNWVQWTNTNEGGYYENFIDVAVSPYAGADIHVPLLRYISGTENFMGYDANLSIIVQDQSAVVAPIPSQYSTDGGTNWTDFEMTLAKTNYTFTGTIPGQPDGTTALVKFYLEDELSNAAWSDEYEVMWSKDSPVLFEGFEGPVFPPENWTLQTTGAGFVRVDRSSSFISSLYEGQYSAVHLDDQGAQDDWLITPPIVLPAENACTVSFWQNGFFVEFYGFSEVCVSTDMVNWTQIYETDFDPDNWELTEDIWKQIKFSLGAWAGQTVYVGFHYTGDYSHQWYIDNVEVLYDYSGPQITDIEGNPALLPVIGAYVDNPMVIELDVSDLSGIKSVTGNYDIGGQTGTVDFSMSKAVEEVWTGVIPAQSAEAVGTINFTLVDIGDLVNNTEDYSIEFVVDNDEPIVKYFINNTVFVGEDMNLELAFNDESPIESCVGYYSKDFFETPAYEFTMNPSKINEYVYTGTIPAEIEEVFFNGRVYFVIRDTAGNELTTPHMEVKWLDGQRILEDDFESGLANWTVTGKWGTQDGTYVSANNSLTESVNSLYGNNQDTYATLAANMDWTDIFSASISFWCKYDIEAGFDYMYFDVTPDGGAEWINLKVWDGNQDWNKVVIPLDAICGTPQANFRFRFVSDQGLELDGMFIDDIVMDTYNKDYGAPTIVHTGPQFYEGVSGDFTSIVKVTDKSGVASVKVYYTVEGIEGEQWVDAVLTTENNFEFTIPAQEAGRSVSYRIWAEDSTEYANSGYSKSYEYISGLHLVYDAGIVSFYTTTDAGDAKAVRMTAPYETKIAYGLIRNYQDLTNFSGTMTFHLWEDNGGVPGADMITPFDFESECSEFNTSAMARIDLRPYDITVNGDFWIGFVAKDATAFTTMEDPGVEGTEAFSRSYDGLSDGSGGWMWSVYATANYHIRAVLGDYSGIETGSSIPVYTELKQNYPNPFNPTTTIRFNLDKDAKVSLVVYDVMGREVARIVNSEMSKGSHSVNFDASKLVSGVYYYNLKAGDVNQTKKMMFIK